MAEVMNEVIRLKDEVLFSADESGGGDVSGADTGNCSRRLHKIILGGRELTAPIKSTYEEQSRKGPRHNLDLSRKQWETPRLSFSQ